MAPKLQHLYNFLIENRHIQPIRDYKPGMPEQFNLSRDVFRRLQGRRPDLGRRRAAQRGAPDLPAPPAGLRPQEVRVITGQRCLPNWKERLIRDDDNDDRVAKVRGGRLVLATMMFSIRGVAAEPVEVPGFESTEAMIPMRDGVKLHTLIFSPRGAQGNLPILFLRTPYGIDGRAGIVRSRASRSWPTTATSSPSRTSGENSSPEGEFVMIRPPRDPADPKAIDEGTDAYDTIDWLIKNVRGHNGTGRHAGRLVRRLADGHGPDRAAPGAQGGLAPGLASRHVPGRRLPP